MKIDRKNKKALIWESKKGDVEEYTFSDLSRLSNTDTMSWMVLFYAFEPATNNLYARSFSDGKPIDGWSN